MSFDENMDCLCKVSAGELHSDKCYAEYVLPLQQEEEGARKRLESARDDIVECARRWRGMASHITQIQTRSRIMDRDMFIGLLTVVSTMAVIFFFPIVSLVLFFMNPVWWTFGMLIIGLLLVCGLIDRG